MYSIPEKILFNISESSMDEVEEMMPSDNVPLEVTTLVPVVESPRISHALKSYELTMRRHAAACEAGR